MTWPDWLTPVMTRSAVHFYWLLYCSLSVWTYWSGGDHRGSMSWSGIDRRSESWRWSWPLASGHWDWRTRSIDQWLERLLLLMAGLRWEELVCRSSEISFISFFPSSTVTFILSCDLQGAADTPEPPVPLLFLTFVASRPPETSKAALKLLPQHACFGFKVSQNFPGWRKDFDWVLIVRGGSYGSPSGPWWNILSLNIKTFILSGL